MYKKAKYITTVSGSDKKTAYLLCKNPQTLIPLELKDESKHFYPDFKTFSTHILNALKTKIACAKIYKYQDGILYTYVTFKQNGRCVDINTPPVVAMKICQMFGAPLLIKDAIVKNLGFRITKEMIRKALEENYRHTSYC